MKNMWLNVPGAKLLASERRFLKDSAELLQEQKGDDYKLLIVNIGVMWGASMHCFREGAPNATLMGIDIDFDTNKVHYRPALNCMLVKGDSTKIHDDNDLCRNLKIDLLFIDGSHKYEDVAADVAGWVPKVLPGGMVIFHDYNPAPEDLKRDPSLTGVKKAVDEWVFAWSSEKLAPRQDFEEIEAPGSLAAFVRHFDDSDQLAIRLK